MSPGLPFPPPEGISYRMLFTAVSEAHTYALKHGVHFDLAADQLAFQEVALLDSSKRTLRTLAFGKKKLGELVVEDH